MQSQSLNSRKLAVVKTVHTIIYLVMVISVFYVLYAAIIRSFGVWLYVALTLLAIESIVFLGNGMRCPLTNLAKRYGDPKGYVGDTFLPEKFTKYTFRVFGGLFVIGLIALAMDIWFYNPTP